MLVDKGEKMHPTFGFIAFDMRKAKKALAINQWQIEQVLTSLSCQIITWNLLDVAMSFVNTPYELGANITYAPDSLDCSGLSKLIFACAGVWLPRYTVLQVDHGEKIKSDNRKPGDLIFFKGKNPWLHPGFERGIGHVGFVLDEKTFLHTTSKTEKVILSEIADLKWPILACRRILACPKNLTVIRLPEELFHLTSPEEIYCLIRSKLKQSRLQ
ncbi:MAG: hypothetical protein COT26_02885 [Candidatus Kerfeldbacteria bacterium CG08_land_8_20_14_0_20_43_14]|uniref:NlpC/P60 domain-containing protein n=1 Tax=Candidatus Kerfeldbacteria bacterium CG08_land_8_20_14_0_20_43_14 TaxID=2014246 RepID=A0A2H0YPW1_9BACT|nr:MAG: hypothetical protein COT26_02885 [Candidatus Kerfeldbacteria bacterium CG08_land_8_20_14_0_20_43_14]